MELVELLRAEDPAIAAEARYLELRRQYRQIRRIGGNVSGGLEMAPNPAYAVLAPFVGSAIAAARRGATGAPTTASQP